MSGTAVGGGEIKLHSLSSTIVYCQRGDMLVCGECSGQNFDERCQVAKIEFETIHRRSRTTRERSDIDGCGKGTELNKASSDQDKIRVQSLGMKGHRQQR